MGAKVIPLHKTHEVDVIARKTPGHRDLRDQVGTLFIDSHPDGTPYQATFEPLARLKNAVIDVTVLNETEEHVTLVDADDGKLWSFEVNDIDEADHWDDDDDA